MSSIAGANAASSSAASQQAFGEGARANELRDLFADEQKAAKASGRLDLSAGAAANAGNPAFGPTVTVPGRPANPALGIGATPTARYASNDLKGAWKGATLEDVGKSATPESVRAIGTMWREQLLAAQASGDIAAMHEAAVGLEEMRNARNGSGRVLELLPKLTQS